MHMSNNLRTKQLLGVKQARLIMNDPHSSSLSGLNLWLPIPDHVISNDGSLCESPHDPFLGWEKAEWLMMLWTAAICCNRG